MIMKMRLTMKTTEVHATWVLGMLTSGAVHGWEGVVLINEAFLTSWRKGGISHVGKLELEAFWKSI